MPLSHRVERIAEQVREEASQIVAAELSDPRIGLITVTRVKITPDLSLARIYWTSMSDVAERKQTAKALAHAAPYVRHLLATRLTLRRSPEVQFIFDQSVAAQERVEQILQDLKREEEARQPEAAPAEPAPPATPVEPAAAAAPEPSRPESDD